MRKLALLFCNSLKSDCIGKIALNTIVIALISCNASLAQENVALHKKYTLSDIPNYAGTSTDIQAQLLTDGVFTSGHFWNAKTTYGWSNVKKLSIEIDLEKPVYIKDVTYNTARGITAGVNFPSNIFIFTSLDKINYQYAGDAAFDVENIPGNYLIKNFRLNNINSQARYVQLVIVANGTFTFCDEITVTGGSSVKNTTTQSFIEKSRINSFTDSLRTSTSDQVRMIDKVKRYNLQNVQMIGTKVGNLSNDKVGSNTQLSQLLSIAKSKRLNYLNEKFGNEYIIDVVSPWDNIISPYQPRGGNPLQYNVETVINGVQYGGLIITNLFNSKSRFTINLIGNNDGVSIELFDVPFVTMGKSFTEIPDPLNTDVSDFLLEPGESRLIVFKIRGKKAGNFLNKIQVTANSKTSLIPIKSNIANIKFGLNNFSLNAVNWAYLNFPLISDRKTEAIKDLETHHINVMSIPSNIVPSLNESNFQKYISYLRTIGNPKYVFLEMNIPSGVYREESKQYNGFMSPAWKDQFKAWYNKVITASKQTGIPENKIYLYPYDEVKGKDIDDFYQFLTWIKVAIPSAKTYATLSSENAIRKLTSFVNIAQIAGPLDQVGKIPINNLNQTWYYATIPVSEQLSPYGYYRLMGWQAFYYGFTGVGFWNYADYRDGHKNKAQLDQFDGVNSINYSAIYDGPNGQIISTRRWEAFQLGIEDYELLKLYSNKFGPDKAKLLAESVVNNAKDVSKADSVRNQIIQELK